MSDTKQDEVMSDTTHDEVMSDTKQDEVMSDTKQDVPLYGHVMQIMTLMALGLEEIKTPCHCRQITTCLTGNASHVKLPAVGATGRNPITIK